MKVVENDKKVYKKTTNFVDANMINVNVILKMKFLIEINFLMNWKKNTWKLQNERATFKMKKKFNFRKMFENQT